MRRAALVAAARESFVTFCHVVAKCATPTSVFLRVLASRTWSGTSLVLLVLGLSAVSPPASFLFLAWPSHQNALSSGSALSENASDRALLESSPATIDVGNLPA